MTTPAHEQTFTFTEHDEIPGHIARGAETAEFERNKSQIEREHPGCWFGIKGLCDLPIVLPLEGHHWGCEDSLWNDCDPVKLKRVLEAFDPYGYSAAMKDIPITSVDDIRNLILLCIAHHRDVGIGVHHISMPPWIAQASAREGIAVTDEEAALEKQGLSHP